MVDPNLMLKCTNLLHVKTYMRRVHEVMHMRPRSFRSVLYCLYFHILHHTADCEVTDVNANISSNNFTITVHFIADDPNAVFQCRLNSREFISCKLTSCMYVCISELRYRERNGVFYSSTITFTWF